ncbi:hypothetical protein BDQ12DRAFT_618315 [Crucibulum laeve]|uniref:Uncharacterized protein n=1 Tax=Crucibulum laeve TaxID=68775 RepID=A0A5C3LGD0_9AGAR|nr:hypothetical protein BDQ12DRAFT_618315 [Crucibulum laeve]
MNILVAFGPSEDSFFLGGGRRACYNNIPQSLVDKINTGQLPVMETSWISIDKTGKYWCAEKFTGRQPTGESSRAYQITDTNISSTLQQHIDQSGAQYVSFPEYDGVADDPPFFVKHKNRGDWNASLPTQYSKAIKELQDTLPTFTDQLKWIIFGSGGTYLIQVDQGYIANVEGPHEDPNHLLNKVLTEFGNGAWNIDRGSTLCLYDHRYFYLKFKNARTGSVEMRYHLPPVMENKVVELLALSRTAAEQHGNF